MSLTENTQNKIVLTDISIRGEIVAILGDSSTAIIRKVAGTGLGVSDYLEGILPQNTTSYGVSTDYSLMTGQEVLCVGSRVSPDLMWVSSCLNAPGARLGQFVTHNLLFISLNFTTDHSVTSTTYATEFIKKASVLHLQNHRSNPTADIADSDYNLNDKSTGVGVRIDRDVVTVRGSHLANISASSTGTVRVVAAELQHHTMYSLTVDCGYYKVDNRAGSVPESFGAYYDINYQKADDTEGVGEYKYTVKQSYMPLYRMQQILGPCIRGKESIIADIHPNGDEKLADFSQYTILAKLRQAYSGELTTASAAGIRSLKTPNITCVTQLHENCTDMRQAFEYTKELQAEEKEWDEDRIKTASLLVLLDTLLSGDYLEILKEQMAKRGLAVTDWRNKLFTPDTSDDSALYLDSAINKKAAGPTTLQEYKIPDSIVITDPVTQKTTTYFRASSMISQDPDGSISICDGYGSLIRMSRGNIYINPALDLFFRPGRDLTAMVPRYQTYNSQQACTINSSMSMHIQAREDLRVAGATSGEGVVSIVSMSKTAASGLQAEAIGLNIQSYSHLSMTACNNIAIARTGLSGDANILKGSYALPDVAGSVLVCAGSNGSLMLLAKNATGVAELLVFCAAGTQAQKAAITIKNDSIGIYTTKVYMPCAVDMISQDNVTVSIKRAASQLALDVTLSTVSKGSLSLKLGGALRVGKFAIVENYLTAKKRLRAPVVQSADGYASKISGGSSDLTQPGDFNPSSEAPVKFGLAASSTLQASTQNIGQNYYTAVSSFKYPAYGTASLYTLPAALWQARSALLVKLPSYWQELGITYKIASDQQELTMCYPGYEAWQKWYMAGVSYNVDSGWVLGTLLDHYIINA